MDRHTEFKSKKSDVTKEGIRAREFRQSFVEWWNLAAEKSREQQEAIEQRRSEAA